MSREAILNAEKHDNDDNDISPPIRKDWEINRLCDLLENLEKERMLFVYGFDDPRLWEHEICVLYRSLATTKPSSNGGGGGVCTSA